MSTPPDPFVSSFPENACVNLVWWLFAVFWVVLACLYVPLCFVKVPYDGSYSVKAEKKAQKKAQAAQQAKELKERLEKEEEQKDIDIPILLSHMTPAGANYPDWLQVQNASSSTVRFSSKGDTYHAHAERLYREAKRDLQKAKDEWNKEWNILLNSNMNPINPYRIVNEINKNIDHENTIVTHDAGHPRDQMMPFITATNPGSYIGWGKSTHLGYGIPLMIGAKIAEPEKFCINFMGDGAFGMSGLDIETSQRSGNPITTVVMNNGTMGGYPQNYPQSIEKFQTIKMTGNYAKIAEGMGAKGISVEEPSEIKNAILDARKFNDDGYSVLIDIKTQPELKMSNYSELL